MNTKWIKSFLVLCLFVISLSLVGCTTPENPEEPGDEEDNGEEIVQAVGLDIAEYVLTYEVGQELNVQNLKASARYSDGAIKDVTGLVTIDSSKYDKTKDGTYEIIVSYTEGENIVKSFFLAVVGTGINSGGSNEGEGDKNFGSGTYLLDAAVELQNYDKNLLIATGVTFASGFFTVLGTGTKRANSETYAVELPKNETGWIEFEVTGTATVQLIASSTGSTNTSSIAIYDSENSVVANNEGLTSLSGTEPTILSYTLTTGTYRILSQANTANSIRGVRIYSVTVEQ